MKFSGRTFFENIKIYPWKQKSGRFWRTVVFIQLKGFPIWEELKFGIQTSLWVAADWVLLSFICVGCWPFVVIGSLNTLQYSKTNGKPSDTNSYGELAYVKFYLLCLLFSNDLVFTFGFCFRRHSEWQPCWNCGQEELPEVRHEWSLLHAVTVLLLNAAWGCCDTNGFDLLLK